MPYILILYYILMHILRVFGPCNPYPLAGHFRDLIFIAYILIIKNRYREARKGIIFKLNVQTRKSTTHYQAIACLTLEVEVAIDLIGLCRGQAPLGAEGEALSLELRVG